MDIYDQATERKMLDRDICIKNSKKPVLVATGLCLNCSDKVRDNRCFCSVECREDHTKRARFKNTDR
jgi:hypothetical protein